MESPKLFSPEMATAAASLNVMGRLIAVSSPGWMNFARRAAPTSEMPRRLMARQASFTRRWLCEAAHMLRELNKDSG